MSDTPLAHGDRVTVAGRPGRVTAVTAATDTLIVATDDGDVIECTRANARRCAPPVALTDEQKEALLRRIGSTLEGANDAAREILRREMPGTEISTTLISSVLDHEAQTVALHLATHLPKPSLAKLFEAMLSTLRAGAWDLDTSKQEDA